MDIQIGAMRIMRVSTTLLLYLCLCLVTEAAQGQSPANSSYTEVFYPSGSLRIHAFLYKAIGDGPFPVVIYNHGARSGRPRRPGTEPVYRHPADSGWVRGTDSRAPRLRRLRRA